MEGFVDWLQTKITRLQLHSDHKINQAWKSSFKMVDKPFRELCGDRWQDYPIACNKW